MTPAEFEDYLFKEVKLDPSTVERIYTQDKKLIAYSLLSLKSKLPAKVGQF